MLEWFRELLAGLAKILASLMSLHRKIDRLEALVMTNQDTINTLAGQLDTVITTVQGLGTDIGAEIDALKAQIAAGAAPEQLDFTAVEAKVAGLSTALQPLQTIDTDNAPAAPVDPGTPTPPPVDDSTPGAGQ
jgi:hypothetical protein